MIPFLRGIQEIIELEFGWENRILKYVSKLFEVVRLGCMCKDIEYERERERERDLWKIFKRLVMPLYRDWKEKPLSSFQYYYKTT